MERIVEKIVEKDRFVRVDDDCECISEAGFIAMWNKIMHIKFTNLRDECLTENRMVDIILSGMKRRDIVNKEVIFDETIGEKVTFDYKREERVVPPPMPIVRPTMPTRPQVQ